MIKIVRAVKTFGQQKILDGFSLELPDRGSVCLFGPSGCGKTTLLHCLAGIHALDGGSIQGLSGKKIACVFQEDRLLPWVSAAENLRAVLPPERRGEAEEWLERAGLAGHGEKKPAELSGGMCRRIAILRALAYGGDVLLLDEPFRGLDYEARAVMMDLIRERMREGLTVLVTHDLREAELLSDKIFFLSGTPLRVTDVR